MAKVSQGPCANSADPSVDFDTALEPPAPVGHSLAGLGGEPIKRLNRARQIAVIKLGLSPGQEGVGPITGGAINAPHRDDRAQGMHSIGKPSRTLLWAARRSRCSSGSGRKGLGQARPRRSAGLGKAMQGAKISIGRQERLYGRQIFWKRTRGLGGAI
jgi:hypothetical protein